MEHLGSASSITGAGYPEKSIQPRDSFMNSRIFNLNHEKHKVIVPQTEA
jgi:hypothetical protein